MWNFPLQIGQSIHSVEFTSVERPGQALHKRMRESQDSGLVFLRKAFKSLPREALSLNLNET